MGMLQTTERAERILLENLHKMPSYHLVPQAATENSTSIKKKCHSKHCSALTV